MMFSTLSFSFVSGVFNHSCDIVTDMTSAEVDHDEDRHMFIISTPGHDNSFLEYEPASSDPRSVDMFETFVPPSLRGRGVAKLLADAAFDWAVKNSVRVKLSCWYLEGHLKRHPRPDVEKLLIR